MGIDDLTRKFEISQEYLEKLKKGEISQEEYYLAYRILLEDSVKETSKIKKNLDLFAAKVNYFKTSIVGLQKRLGEIESLYAALFESSNDIMTPHPFPRQIKEYEEQQEAQKKAKEKNSQASKE